MEEMVNVEENSVMSNTPETGYARRMEPIMRKAMMEYYNSLSKEELLEYMRDQPGITADIIRGMLGSVRAQLYFGVTLDTSRKVTNVSFTSEDTIEEKVVVEEEQ